MTVTETEAAAYSWNYVMTAGRLCRCGHSEVCHWNGENIAGRERFDGTCAMCRGACNDFRDTGHRLASRVRRVVVEDVAPVLDLEEESFDELDDADILAA